MQKRKLKASYKSNKEVSQQTLKLLSENIDKLYDPYEFPRSTISEAAQCQMCQQLVDGTSNDIYANHFESCEKLSVLASCTQCGYEDLTGVVLIHESTCQIRKQSSKEEIVAAYKQEATLPTLTMSCYTKPLCEDIQASLSDILTAQNVILPITQHSPFAPCMSNFLKRLAPWTLNLCMQSVVMSFLSEPIQRTSQTPILVGDKYHTINYTQCHSGRSLLSGEKPIWFECDGRVLMDLKPGEHQFARLNLAPTMLRYWRNSEPAFTPLHTVFVQNVPMKDFMREHSFESGDFELLLSELFPFMDRTKLNIKDLVSQMKNYRGAVSTRLIDMMTAVIVRTQNVFVLKSFKKLNPIEKVQMFGVDVLKPLYKFTHKFETNHENYNVYVVDVIPDVASTMKCFERQNFPIKGGDLISHLVHNQVYGIFVGFYDLTMKQFVSSDFFRLRSISKYERESQLFNKLVNQAEFDDEERCKLLEPYNQALFFAKDFYNEDQNCQQQFTPKDTTLIIPLECLANRSRSTPNEDFASQWEVTPYTLKFMDSKRTVGAQLRKKHEQAFNDFRWQSALCEFDDKYLYSDTDARFECENSELMSRSLAPPLRALGQQMMHWEEIQRGICYKHN